MDERKAEQISRAMMRAPSDDMIRVPRRPGITGLRRWANARIGAADGAC